MYLDICNMNINITKEYLKTFLRCSHHGTPKFKCKCILNFELSRSM